ncbi:MAG: nickel pincer cofactor biosynthesis protein LarC [Blastocatellia bacterium]
MRTLYLDCFAGASGDMFIGAMLDCGLSFDHLRDELTKLDVDGYQLRLTRMNQSGINAAKFDVELTDDPAAQAHEPAHDHPQTHDLPHTHDHGFAAPLPAGHRSLSAIQALIGGSGLGDSVKARALAIFQRIGEAEAKIHGIPLESVHFHEVGAIDSIVDIVGACIALEAMGIERVIASPLHVGSGTFRCAHGTYPVPGPATTELLRGAPMYAGEIRGELVTPTGAAIITTLAAEYGPLPLMRIERAGYGAGTRRYEKFPNVLRAIIGEIETETTLTTITVIEANIDDTNAQVFGHLLELALAAGALDVFYTPVQMKKNRPGTLLTVLCATADRAALTALIFRETTTLGIRYRDAKREILRREHVTVNTAYGPIRLKLGRASNGQIMNRAPEFEDCRAAALSHNVALRDVQTAALTAYERQNES